jgi:hypothetical protein
MHQDPKREREELRANSTSGRQKGQGFALIPIDSALFCQNSILIL